MESLAWQLDWGGVLLGLGKPGLAVEHGLAVGKGVVGVLGKPGLAVEHRAEGFALVAWHCS